MSNNTNTEKHAEFDMSQATTSQAQRKRGRPLSGHAVPHVASVLVVADARYSALEDAQDAKQPSVSIAGWLTG